MSEKRKNSKKTNWAVLAAIYAAASLLFAGFMRLVHGASPFAIAHHFFTDSLVLAVVAALVIIGIGAFAQKHKSSGAHLKKIATHHTFVAAVVFWVGMGIAGYAATALFAKHPSVSFLTAMFSGPFVARSLNSSPVAVPVFALWTLVCLYGLYSQRKHLKGSPQSIVKKATNIERAPAKKPIAAHFLSTTQRLRRVAVEPTGMSNRLILGQSRLADDWGGVMRTRWLAVPKQGNATIFGSSGSGKGLVLQRMLLNLVKDKTPTKFVSLSLAAHGTAQPTAPWLRDQGFKLGTLDLTGGITGEEGYGVRYYWTPLSLVHDWDTSASVMTRILEQASRSEDREQHTYWVQQCIGIGAPALLAAVLSGASYRTALLWMKRLDDPEFTDVTRILQANIPADGPDTKGVGEALGYWQTIRKTLLSYKEADDHELGEDDDGVPGWSKHQGFGSSDKTGLDILTTLRGKMLEFDTAAVRAFTESPNFDHKAWLREPGDAGLFLVGSEKEVETRSLMVPLLDELLNEAFHLANNTPTNKLPYRLVVLMDEIGNLAPIPKLAERMALYRQFGIQLVLCTQGPSQFEKLYGREHTGTILENSQCLLLLAGFGDANSIQKFALLGGSRYDQVTSTTEAGSHTSTTTSEQGRPLIDAHVLNELDKPDTENKVTGTGLLFVLGAGWVKVTIKPWMLTETFTERGAFHPDPELSDVHRKFIDELDEGFNGLKRKAKNWWMVHRPDVLATKGDDEDTETAIAGRPTLLQESDPLAGLPPIPSPELDTVADVAQHPLSLDELRALARVVAARANFGMGAAPEVLTEDQRRWDAVSARTSVGLQDAHVLLLRALQGQLPLLASGVPIPHGEVADRLGRLGAQAGYVANVIWWLRQEQSIADDVAASDHQKASARASRVDGFEYLSRDLARAGRDAAAIAALAQAIAAQEKPSEPDTVETASVPLQPDCEHHNCVPDAETGTIVCRDCGELRGRMTLPLAASVPDISELPTHVDDDALPPAPAPAPPPKRPRTKAESPSADEVQPPSDSGDSSNGHLAPLPRTRRRNVGRRPTPRQPMLDFGARK